MARMIRKKCSMPLRMFSVEGMMGLQRVVALPGWHTAILRAVVAANSSIADGVASALKPRRTRIDPYPAAATARTNQNQQKLLFPRFPLSISPRPSRLPLTSTCSPPVKWGAYNRLPLQSDLFFLTCLREPGGFNS